MEILNPSISLGVEEIKSIEDSINSNIDLNSEGDVQVSHLSKVFFYSSICKYMIRILVVYQNNNTIIDGSELLGVHAEESRRKEKRVLLRGTKNILI